MKLRRLERSGRGDGRVYTIAYVAKDPSGASCSGTVTVTVPHDRGGQAVDSSPQAVSPQAKDKPGRGKANGRGRP